MKRSQAVTVVVLFATLAQVARALPRSTALLKEKLLEDDQTTSTSPGSSWVPVASPVLRQKSRAFDLESADEGHQYEDVDIVTAPPKPPDTFSFVVASDFGGGNSGAHRSRTLEDDSDNPPEEVELVTASEWFSDWEGPQKIKDTTTTAATTTTTTTTTTPKAPRRALPKILIRRRLNSRQRTTTKSPPTTTTTTREALSITKVPPLTEAPTTLRAVVTTTALTTKLTTVTSRPVVSVASTVAPRITTTTTLGTTTLSSTTPRTTTAPSTTTTPYRTYVNRYGPVSDRDNTILRPLPRETTTNPGLVLANGTRKNDGGFIAVAAKSPTKVRTGIRSGREFQDREEQRGDTIPASTSNAEKLSYILVGVCCAVSITCLVVVVTVLRCRKVRQRQRALEQLQESRNLTVSWLEKTHHAFGPGLPPTPVNGPLPGTPGRKPHRRATNESSPDGASPKPQNLWFVRREKLPFLLYDHHSPIVGQGPVPNVTSPASSSGEAVSDGGSSSTLGRNLRYQNHPSGHTSGLDCVKKGELIYWSSNNEQLI